MTPRPKPRRKTTTREQPQRPSLQSPQPPLSEFEARWKAGLDELRAEKNRFVAKLRATDETLVDAFYEYLAVRRAAQELLNAHCAAIDAQYSALAVHDDLGAEPLERSGRSKNPHR